MPAVPPALALFACSCAGVLLGDVANGRWQLLALAAAAALGALVWRLLARAPRGVAPRAYLAVTLALAARTAAGQPDAAQLQRPVAPADAAPEAKADAPAHLVRIVGPVVREVQPGQPARLLARAELLARREAHRGWQPATGVGPIALAASLAVGHGEILALRLEVWPLRAQAAPWATLPAERVRRTGCTVRLFAASGHVPWGPPAPFGLRRTADHARQRLGAAFDAALPPRPAALAKALALGDASSLTSAQRDAWSAAGIAHLLAVSGLHVTLVAHAAGAMARRVADTCRPGAARRGVHGALAAAVGTLAAWGYATLTGGQVAATRAATMATLVQLGAAWGRGRGYAPNALGLAGCALLLQAPQALFAPSFLLSFVAVAALLGQGTPVPAHVVDDVDDCRAAGYGPVPPPGRLGRLVASAASILVTARVRPWRLLAAHVGRPAAAAAPNPRRTVARRLGRTLAAHAAQLALATPARLTEGAAVAAATAPLAAGLFGELPSYAPLVNLVAVPWGTLLCTPLALTTAALLALPMGVPGRGPALRLAAAALSGALQALDALAAWAAALPAARWQVVPPPGEVWAVATAVALAGAWWSGRQPTPGRRLACSFVLLGVTAAGCCAWPARGVGGGALRLWHVDVGHGDATLVQFPDRRWLLVDGGGALYPGARFDPGRQLLGPALRALGVRRLHAVLLTHPHPDHLGGLAYVWTRVAVDALYFGSDADASPAVQRLAAAVRARGGQVGRPPATSSWGGVLIEMMQPLSAAPAKGAADAAAGEDAGADASENDRSVVVRLRFGQTSALLAADVEVRGETALLPALGPTDVLKVAHHGSPTSSSARFLARLRPQLAVVSCGEHSRFGFPHPNVVQRLEAAGARVLDTGRHGTVALCSDGRGWRVRWGGQGPTQRLSLAPHQGF